MQRCPLWSADFADRLTFRRGTMPQLQMETFNRLYKAFTGPDCKPWAVAAHTLRLFLGDSIQTKELFYLPHPYLSPVLSFIFLAVLCFITVQRVLQGLGKWDTGCEGGRKKQRCVFTAEPRSNTRLFVPAGEADGLHIEVCTCRQTCLCSHTGILEDTLGIRLFKPEFLKKISCQYFCLCFSASPWNNSAL